MFRSVCASRLLLWIAGLLLLQTLGLCWLLNASAPAPLCSVPRIAGIVALFTALLGLAYLYLRRWEHAVVRLRDLATQVWDSQSSAQQMPRADLQSLAQVFDDMAAELCTYREDFESRLSERTQALAGATQEIFELTQQLEEENIRMSTELAITRRIQQMLLPRQHELKAIAELDIAGFMEAADEVGGDYYDVLEHNGRVLLAIGDVTGHGLESGMIMLMAQTAVRTLLTDNVTDPVEFLNVVNRTLHDNIQRMNCDKNLTLTLLTYQGGQLAITGQHENVLVIRIDGTVEIIDTSDLGFLVGFQKDIAEFIHQIQINLQPGEGVVLYTDGITEAMNGQDQFYGENRLVGMVAANAMASAKEIQQAIITDVWQHVDTGVLNDDVTLLVVKRLY